MTYAGGGEYTLRDKPPMLRGRPGWEKITTEGWDGGLDSRVKPENDIIEKFRKLNDYPSPGYS